MRAADPRLPEPERISGLLTAGGQRRGLGAVQWAGWHPVGGPASGLFPRTAGTAAPVLGSARRVRWWRFLGGEFQVTNVQPKLASQEVGARFISSLPLGQGVLTSNKP